VCKNAAESDRFSDDEAPEVVVVVAAVCNSSLL